MKLILRFIIENIYKIKIGRYIFDQVIDCALSKKEEVRYGEERLYFCTPNQLNRYRVSTFSNKEPETLDWIDGFHKNKIFWDIGANVGLYSCYAAKAKRVNVFAFEPSVFNLEMLARNIFLNNLTSMVTIIPLPLFNRIEISTLNMTSIDWGGALSTFGESFGWDGKKLDHVFDFRTLAASMDDMVHLLNLPMPNYIKIDVDGIEHLILRGGIKVLEHVDEILVEINDEFFDQNSECVKLLQNAGLILKDKKHAKIFDCNNAFGNGKVWNQIWVKK
jgi:FkbM family methyltransferase